MGIPESTKKRLYDFGLKYWGAVDFNNDGQLNYDEFTYTVATLAVIDAKMFFLFDENGDSILDMEETISWSDYIVSILKPRYNQIIT